MLIHHHDSENAQSIYWFSETSARTKEGQRFIPIANVQASLGANACSRILFMHAWFGSDTTSAIYGYGKKVALKWISQSTIAANLALQFYEENQSSKVVEEAGKQLFKDLYKCNGDKSLNSLRYHLYSKGVATSKTGFKPENLPPTEAAAGYHSKRVYFQVMEWKSLQTKYNPTDWGWELQDHKFVPTMTDQPLAPKDLLSVVRCSCKTSSCSSKSCSCRKSGLPCVAACLHCFTNGCNNNEKATDL